MERPCWDIPRVQKKLKGPVLCFGLPGPAVCLWPASSFSAATQHSLAPVCTHPGGSSWMEQSCSSWCWCRKHFSHKLLSCCKSFLANTDCSLC